MVLEVVTLGSGQPLVVLPSFGLDHLAMAEAIEPAVQSQPQWRRLYVELPGMGSPATCEPTSDAVLGEVVATIREHLGDQQFSVAGWSYGGYLAAGVTRRLPSQIAGLMMICSAFKIRPEDRDLTGVLDSVPEHGWLTDAPSELHDHFVHAVGLQTGEVARRVTDLLSRYDSPDDAYLTKLRSDGFALSDEGVPTRSDAPVSFVTGRRDRIAGYVGLFGSLTDFDAAFYVAFDQPGHYLPVEIPAEFATVIQAWLARCGSL